MRPRILTVGVCLLLLAGCKRGAKDSGPTRDDGKAPQREPGGLPPPAGNTPRGAAMRAVAAADMRDLQVFIDTAALASGRMPSGADIYAALVDARSPAAALVKDGAIVLTGARERESVWAFEANAYLSGGLVVSQNGVERLTAGELKKRLGK